MFRISFLTYKYGKYNLFSHFKLNVRLRSASLTDINKYESLNVSEENSFPALTVNS
jgi:hypothetical protein